MCGAPAAAPTERVSAGPHCPPAARVVACTAGPALRVQIAAAAPPALSATDGDVLEEFAAEIGTAGCHEAAAGAASTKLIRNPAARPTRFMAPASRPRGRAAVGLAPQSGVRLPAA